ncbi:MAG: KTSC domain-containing protein [Alphaproteobacteria bacterium]|nr:KTSC domain-containing protein [Alphaproteobacteria bacterium]
MYPVSSRAIRAIGYDRGRRLLFLEYVGSRTYAYIGVPPDVYARLLAAPSKGQFVNFHIKPYYDHRLVRLAPPRNTLARHPLRPSQSRRTARRRPSTRKR